MSASRQLALADDLRDNKGREYGESKARDLDWAEQMEDRWVVNDPVGIHARAGERAWEERGDALFTLHRPWRTGTYPAVATMTAR